MKMTRPAIYFPSILVIEPRLFQPIEHKIGVCIDDLFGSVYFGQGSLVGWPSEPPPARSIPATQAGQIIFEEFGGAPGNSYTWVELKDDLTAGRFKEPRVFRRFLILSDLWVGKRIDARKAGFFDVDERLTRLRDLGDQLLAFAAAVDFKVFRPALTRALAYSDGLQGGRPPFDPVLIRSFRSMGLFFC